MPRVPDLVKDSKLRTNFFPEHTSHFYVESGRTPRERTVVREECWKRQRYIGGGGYGCVWLEHCVKGQREIALRAVKEIRKPPQSSKPADYNRELEAMAKFSHQQYERCFVKAFGWYENADYISIAMEYFPSGDLQAYLSHKPPLSESEAQEITFQILEGLWYLHENGFSHRDLKPGNILVKSKPPEEWWVKLGDFGISKRAEDNLAVSSTVKGTVGFMAPELHGFIQSGSAQATDMWSLGEIAFQMLTKEPTFRNINLLYAYAQDPNKFPSKTLHANGVSDEGLNFIQSIMDPLPNNRLVVERALGHNWISYRFQNSGLFSTMTTRHHVPQEQPTSSTAGVEPEPSGKWSTISVPSRQLLPLMDEIPRVTKEQSMLGTDAPFLETATQYATQGNTVNQTSYMPTTTVHNQTATHKPIQIRQNRESAVHELPHNTSQMARSTAEETLATPKAPRSQILEGHINYVESIVFSPDGKQLAPAPRDKIVRLWDAAMGTALQKPRGHSHSVYVVVFSPDGKQLASASEDRTVRLWDAATGTALQKLKGHRGQVYAVVFSPDGKQLASASEDRTVKLWDAATGTALQKLRGHLYLVYAVVFSPDGKQLASASRDRTVRLWDAATGTALQKLEGHSDAVHAVVFSPDGKQLASASWDGTVRLWDAATGTALQKLEGHSDAVYAVVFSPDGKQLASASADRTVKLWDAATGTALQKLRGHSYSVHAVVFSPDGKQLASASADRTVRLWDAATGTALQKLKGHSDAVFDVAISPDGKQLASASRDRTVMLWDAATTAAL